MRRGKGIGYVVACAVAFVAVVGAVDEVPAQEAGSGVNIDFVVNAMPASLFLEMDSDNFAVEGEDGRVSISSVYMMPNISAGIGFQFENVYLDATAGAGVLINDSFRSFLLQAGVGLHFMPSDSFTVGPRLGVIYFPDPDWLEGDELDFDPGVGYVAGLQMTMGDRISYMFSVDLMSAEFDFDTEAGVVTDDDKLDLFGLAIQFGVRGEF